MILFTEDGRFVSVVFELKQIVRGVFQKERAVLDARAWKPHTWLLIEGEAHGFGSIRQSLPLVL